MSDDTITEEQKQVKCIIKRWRTTKKVADAIIGVMFLCLLVAAFYFYFRGDKKQSSYLIFLLIWFVLTAAHSFSEIILTPTVLSLQDKEIAALDHAYIDAPLEEQRTIRTILEKHRRAQPYPRIAKPEMVLLRASTEPQDDTLLRAAHYTDNAPKDQLLRPTSTDE